MTSIPLNRIFPKSCPQIVITEQKIAPQSFDLKELRWWFCIPTIGEHTFRATYIAPRAELVSVTEMEVVRKAQIHGIDGVEIIASEWETGTDTISSEWVMYATLQKDVVGWLGVAEITSTDYILRTFLDPSFEDDWGTRDRMIAIAKDIRQCTPARFLPSTETICTGVCTVQIGEGCYSCLRVIEHDREPSDRSIFIEAFITEEGRTILLRRYNGLSWERRENEVKWNKLLPECHQIVMGSVNYVHWYDCISHQILTNS